VKRLLALFALAAGSCFAQNFDLLLNQVTSTQISQIARGASVNQFHQLTVIAQDITAGSCSGGFTGALYLLASQDNVIYVQFGLQINSVADNTLAFTTASGSFQYIKIDYASGNTSQCKITAWYSGTVSGAASVSVNASVNILGNANVYNGGQNVTTSAAALPSQASKQICVKATSTNTASIYVGNSTVTNTGSTIGQELTADEAVCLPVANVNEIFVISASGTQGVTWVATN
jgi:hypothetical protein